MTRITPAEPPYEPAIAAELERIMPSGVPPLMLFRTMAKSPRIFAKMFAGGLFANTNGASTSPSSPSGSASRPST